MSKVNRMLSLFLSLIMVFTMLPVPSAFANSFASTTTSEYSYTYTGDSNVVWGTEYINDVKSASGYKISVWFAEKTGEKEVDGKTVPVYGWGDDEYTKQIGQTTYWRRIPLQTDSGQPIGIDFWIDENVYSQVTQGKDWEESIIYADMGQTFYYTATSYYLEENESNRSWTGGRIVNA